MYLYNSLWNNMTPYHHLLILNLSQFIKLAYNTNMQICETSKLHWNRGEYLTSHLHQCIIRSMKYPIILRTFNIQTDAQIEYKTLIVYIFVCRYYSYSYRWLVSQVASQLIYPRLSTLLLPLLIVHCHRWVVFIAFSHAAAIYGQLYRLLFGSWWHPCLFVLS